MIPTLQVVKVQTANILAGSVPQLQGSKTSATSGNLGRSARFSRWEEDEEWEE